MTIDYRGMTIILRPWRHTVAVTWHLPSGQEVGSAENHTMKGTIALAKAHIDQMLCAAPVEEDA
jgi:hypothetical protein